MRKAGQMIMMIVMIAAAGVAVAHHAAQGTVDEEIYLMIDELVGDTPHGEMTIEDLGSGMMQIVIFDVTVREIENMIDDGLLNYSGMLDGEVTAVISFASMRDSELVIYQQK